MFLIGMMACQKRVVPVGETTVVGEPVIKVDTFRYRYTLTEAMKNKLLGKMGDALTLFQEAIRMNPGSDAAHYEIGNIALMMGDTPEAISRSKSALAIDSSNIWYYLQLSSAYYRAGNLDSCTYFYGQLLDRWPERDDHKLNLANIYLEGERFDQAIVLLQELQLKYPDSEQVVIGLYNAYLRTDEFSRAEEYVQRLIQLDPENSNYLGLLAELYRRMDRPEEAAETYERLMLADPDNILARISGIDFLLEKKDYDLAIQEIERFILSGDGTNDQRIDILAQLLEEQTAVKTYGNQILGLLRTMEETYPDERRVIILKFEYYDFKGDLLNAVAQLEEFVSENKTNYEVYEQLLFKLNEAEMYHKLNIYGRTATTIFNWSPILKIMYAIGASESREYEVAIDQLRKSLIYASESPELQEQIYSILGDVYYKQGRSGKAFEIFEELLQKNSENALVLNNYAYYLAEQDTALKKAHTMAKKCIELEPENPTYQDTYAWVLYKNGDFRKAWKTMEAVIRAGGTTDPDVLEHAAYILLAIDRDEDALLYFRMALEAGSEKVDELQKQISKLEK